VAFEYVAASDFQVAVRLLSIGQATSVSIRPPGYVPLAPGIELRAGASTGDQIRQAVSLLRGVS
jgi:hypothetical protein